MKNKFTFIGDENDTKTKIWGIKKGNTYKIDFPALPTRGGFIAIIETPKSGDVVCPYVSSQAFNNNWK